MQRKGENQGNGILAAVNFDLSLPRRAARPVDVVAVGENSVDLICVSDRPVRLDGKVRLEHRVQLPGGQAATAAVGCARLGWRVEYVGVVGDDAFAAIVVEALEREGVSSTIVRRSGVPTRTAVVIVNTAEGTRTVLEHRAAGLSAAAGEVAEERFIRGRVVLVDGTDLPLSIRAARAARQSGARTVADLEEPTQGIEELLALIDVPIVTESFVRTLTGAPSVGEALRLASERFRSTAIVATLGADGALAVQGGREVWSPARLGQAVDTTGAGDAFRAGFISGWLSSEERPDLGRLLAWGAAVASLNCRRIGAQTGLPTRGDLEGLV